jgi:aminoglycoside/choline kinase family phosphotransferase
MEIVNKNVLKDFRYPEMEKLKMENEILRQWLLEKREKLTRKDKKLKQVTRSCDGLIDVMCSSNQRIQNSF